MVASALASILIMVLAFGNAHQNQCSSMGDSKIVNDKEECSLSVVEQQESSSRAFQPNDALKSYHQFDIGDSSADNTDNVGNQGTIVNDSVAWFEPLLSKIQWKDLLKCFSLLNESLIRIHGSYGRTILHFLVSQDDFESAVLEDLLNFKADINAVDAYGQTPLHLAVILNKPKVVKSLLDHRADTQIRSKEGSTALHLALFLKYDDIAVLLLQHEPPILPGQLGDPSLSDDNDALHLGIYANACDSVFQQLLEAGKGRNSLQQDDFGWRDIKVVFWRYPTLNSGIGDPYKPEPEAVDIVINNVGPLIHHAIYKCRKQLLEVLMRAGVNPQIEDPDGSTPLHLAVEYCPEVVDHLIKARVPINKPNKFDQTALHLAAEKGDETVIKNLIVAGASLSSKDKQGQTPIAYAENADCFQCADLLRDTIAEEAALELEKHHHLTGAFKEMAADQNAVLEEQVLTSETPTEEQMLTIEMPTERQIESDVNTSDGYLSSSRTYLSVALILSCMSVSLIIL